MNKTYILIDAYNMFYRAMYGVQNTERDLKNNMLLHTMFYMIKKACDKFNPNHLVVAMDGNGTWRKSLYPLYKANRQDRFQDMTPAEVETYESLKNTFENDFIPFLTEKTNISVIGCKDAEADDIISRFIKLHPNDLNVIISSDNDYVQLLADNVLIYNTMDDRLITKEGIVGEKNKLLKFTLKDGKITVSKTDPFVGKNDSAIPMKDWIDYALFMKCVRGDKSDNIFSAYPRVREKSTAKIVGISEAFEDRIAKGYNWQSFMNSTWKTPLGETKVVKECYELNKKIIDLNEIPESIKIDIDQHIKEVLNKEPIKNVPMYLVRYLQEHQLIRLGEIIGSFSQYFINDYKK